VKNIQFAELVSSAAYYCHASISNCLAINAVIDGNEENVDCLE